MNNISLDEDFINDNSVFCNIFTSAQRCVFNNFRPDKQNTWIFVNFSDKSDQNPQFFDENLRYLVLKFGILLHKSTVLTGKSIFFSIYCTFMQRTPEISTFQVAGVAGNSSYK